MRKQPLRRDEFVTEDGDVKRKTHKKVIAQYEAIRRLGQTNMFDKNMVQRIAYENEFYELVEAIEEDYAEILRNYSKWMTEINEEDIPEARPIRASWQIDNSG